MKDIKGLVITLVCVLVYYANPQLCFCFLIIASDGRCKGIVYVGTLVGMSRLVVPLHPETFEDSPLHARPT
jgi:hypothetical protein